MNALARYFASTPDDRPFALAKRIGCAPSTITRLVTGDRQPSPKLAKEIERETNRAVKATELLGLDAA